MGYRRSWKLAQNMIKVYGTNDPLVIADHLDIHVWNERLPLHIGGFFTRIFDSSYIVINSEKPRTWKRAIAAHELGHALLHDHEHIFLSTSNFVTQSKIEHEANLFAATLLIGDERPEQDESIYDFARRMYVPIEFITSLPWDFFKQGGIT